MADNRKTKTIFCGECDHLQEMTRGTPSCMLFQETLRESILYHPEPVKCLDCALRPFHKDVERGLRGETV